MRAVFDSESSFAESRKPAFGAMLWRLANEAQTAKRF